jgi:hypothetical protein
VSAFRGSPEASLQSVVDMHVLAASDALLLSPGSSFGAAAWALAGSLESVPVSVNLEGACAAYPTPFASSCFNHMVCSYPGRYQREILDDPTCVSASDDEMNGWWGVHFAQELQGEGDDGRICCCLKNGCRR